MTAYWPASLLTNLLVSPSSNWAQPKIATYFSHKKQLYFYWAESQQIFNVWNKRIFCGLSKYLNSEYWLLYSDCAWHFLKYLKYGLCQWGFKPTYDLGGLRYFKSLPFILYSFLNTNIYFSWDQFILSKIKVFLTMTTLIYCWTRKPVNLTVHCRSKLVNVKLSVNLWPNKLE